MRLSTRLIVLKITRTGEKSLVVHAISPELGRRSYIVTAGRGMAMWQPLSVLDAEIVENPKSSLWRLHSVSPVHRLSGLRSSVVKNAAALFISEVLWRTIREGVLEDGLWEWVEESILKLDAIEADACPNFHLRWLLELCGALGFSPTREDLMPFAGERLEEIGELLTLDYAQSLLLPLNGSTRSEIAEILLQYLGYHCETAINVRSLSVLHELFSS